MNSLSWLIYLAEISGRAQHLSGGLAFFLGIMGAFGLAGLWIHHEDVGKKVASFLTALFVFVELILMGAAIALPSSKTLYMIAASEIGETVVTSPDAEEMIGDLKAIIRQKLKEQINEAPTE